MSCERAETTLHGYFDNELDAVGAAEFERHLASCSECSNELAELNNLRSSLSAAGLYKKAPAPLRKKVTAKLGSATEVAVMPSRTPWRWLALAAAMILCAYGGWRVASIRHGDDYETVLAAEIVDAHLRSLQPGHSSDVISTDQHTVKPWFAGRLDFAPPVRDFADRGFPLQGGRLDVIRGRTIAALVYSRRKHIVNVFIWPANEGDTSVRQGSQQGYQWIEWRKGGMEFFAVSDTASADLAELQKLLAQ